MSASDEIWILGIRMTKFGKHPDLDTVDLAAQAATGALADAGVSMADIGVLAAGNLMAANAGIGQAAMPPAWLKAAGQPSPAQSGREVSVVRAEIPAVIALTTLVTALAMNEVQTGKSLP